MQIKYSPSTMGFYSLEFGNTPPADAIVISADEHAALIAGQDAGQMIVPGRDGRPVLQAPPCPPPPTAEDVKREAARRLQPTDWYVVRAADPSDMTPVPQAVLDLRAAIRAAAEVLEAMEQIPADYRDDKHWP